jgi:hypothetical protein
MGRQHIYVSVNGKISIKVNIDAHLRALNFFHSDFGSAFYAFKKL